MIPHIWFKEASTRIFPYIRRTALTQDLVHNWWIKWENQQITGSFKARGAINKVITLSDWEQKRGLVTASAGNHGQGVALAGNIVNAPVIVFAPKNAVQSKIQAMRELGAKVQLVHGLYGAVEQSGLEYAQSTNSTWISPYNDGQVIAGQGTIAMEVCEDWPGAYAANWIVPVGGGGLISGIAAFLKSDPGKRKTVKVIGVQPIASAFMYNIYRHGTQDDVNDLPTLADGLAGAVENGSITIPLVRKYVDEMILVTEEEISQAIAFAWHNYHQKIEGSAATALAAVITKRVSTRPAILVISGGNILPEIHTRIIKDNNAISNDR